MKIYKKLVQEAYKNLAIYPRCIAFLKGEIC